MQAKLTAKAARQAHSDAGHRVGALCRNLPDPRPFSAGLGISLWQSLHFPKLCQRSRAGHSQMEYNFATIQTAFGARLPIRPLASQSGQFASQSNHLLRNSRTHEFMSSRSGRQPYQPIHSKSAQYATPIQMMLWTSQAESRNFAAVRAVCVAGF